ncbi:Chromosome-associated kinesin KIF4 [Frankliniella fusca]|uniref:Chromosome-associated kinesin KIF4 n=1 Tax=Frankliniella fusca TaxID=407009 RepID=A0AAE1H8V0_9NEOP|nr:Chromosome-associated kinesin KIF4 [Frankliniella fusca]
MDDAIKVALRVRPLSSSELARGCQPCLDCIPNEPQVVMRNSDKAFTYNYVFSQDSSQADVYDLAVKSLVKQLFKGYNVTILAYGQTGSGKTYSMGTCFSGEGEMGIIPRAISDIFEIISVTSDKDFKVSTSFMELYKEQLFDLLACNTKPRDQCVVDIREDARGGIRIPGLLDMEVFNAEDTFKALAMGSTGRATGATAMNAQSSRSHAIFTITIQMSKKNNGGEDTVAKFHLVDLAGSERSKKTGATGERFKEGVNINKGLLALGNVISALGDGQQRGYVSYRDSKLTRLLQDSLGGNSMTLMVACVSPADYNCEETLSTLRYADRARHIRNKPIVNQDPKTAEILRLQKENTELRLQLLGNGGTIGTCPPEHLQLGEENELLKTKNRKLTEALNNAINESTNLMERALLAELARDRINVKLKELNAKCNMTIETFESEDLSPTALTNGNLAGLKDLQSKILELQAEQQQGEEEIKKHELSEMSSTKNTSQSAIGNQTIIISSPFTSETIAELDQQEEKHTFHQAELNQELQDLTRALAIKEQLAATLAANSSGMNTLNPEHKETMKQLESQISTLQQERDMLQQQLKSVQSNSASSKIAEQRRKRLQELEAQMSDLKKKLLEQSKIIKMKEKTDEKVVVLNNEIRSMKAMKVRLIRQMKQEGEQFREWKLQREKELNKLRDQDRKRQNIMNRMENMHSKQQNVLKRKVEEAAAINKRLKDALLLQKQCQEKRQQTLGKPERVQAWIAQELEVSASTVAAMRVRDKLIEDRAVISQQLGVAEESLKTALPSEEKCLKQEISRLKEDLQLRSAQIADMNQKILDSDQENKAKTRWDTIQSMVDAKCALKYLFQSAVEFKKDVAMKEYTVEELEDACKKLTAELKVVENKLHSLDQKHKTEILELEKESVEKVAVLLNKLRETDRGTSHFVETDSDLRKKIEMLEDENKYLRSVADKIESLKESYNNSKGESMSMAVSPKTPPKQTKKKKSANEFKSPQPLNITFTDSEGEVFTDDENDPDWRQTPLMKRLQSFKSKRSTISENSSGSDSMAVKRNSDGTTYCTCSRQGTCLRCPCRKTGFSCSDSCSCAVKKCSNRNKENLAEIDTSADSLNGEAKRPR